MVSKVEGAAGVLKRRAQNQQAAATTSTSSSVQCRHLSQNQMQKQVMIQLCNKDKVNKFKRSSSNLEDDGISSAILLLACIACANP